jgi:hypothetical protein
MTRRSLRPQLNQIRAWVQQGRTDAWIAHQLEVTVQQIQAFKRDQGLAPAEETEGAATTDFDDEIDLRAQDDALIAAELDAAESERSQEPADEDEDEDQPRRPPVRSRRRSTTATRVTGCGSTPPSRMTRCTPSTGPATGRWRSRSRRTRS